MDSNDKDGGLTLEELVEINCALSTERDLNTLLSTIVTAARKISHADAGRVYIIDQARRHLYVELAQSDNPARRRHEFPPVPLYLEGERNMTNLMAYAAFMGRSISIADINKYSGFDFSDLCADDRAAGVETRCLLAVPLRTHRQITVGVLLLINIRDPRTERVVSLPQGLEAVINAFAAQAAVAIDNVQLFEKNRRLIDVLDTTNRQLEEENTALRNKIQGKYDFSRIIGESPAMRSVFSLIEKIVESDAIVLIRGETGTGKELIAHALHYNSRRRNKAFVTQNCAALPENLLESELFGYKRGAFSGAASDKKGLFELADGGTLFLDEIGDMPLPLQAKLLRVLQDNEVRPLGATESRRVNVRVVAATHCDLEASIKSGEFREDLYYRLCVFPIELPPLRERKEDLPALLQHYLQHFSEKYHKPLSGFAPAALEVLLDYDYPGNVRDLHNIIERAVLMCEADGSILPEHLPDHLQELAGRERGPQTGASLPAEGPLKELVERYEAAVIREKLEACHWNQTKAAGELKVSRRTLIDKINRYGIGREPATQIKQSSVQ